MHFIICRDTPSRHPNHVYFNTWILQPSPFSVPFRGYLSHYTKWQWQAEEMKQCFRPLTGLSSSLLYQIWIWCHWAQDSVSVPLRGIYLITLASERPVFMRPFKVLCFSLMSLSPILNHSACGHLHQLIIICILSYVKKRLSRHPDHVYLNTHILHLQPMNLLLFRPLTGLYISYRSTSPTLWLRNTSFRPLTGLSISLLNKEV